ncbi:MAG: reverse transcriptase-like protein [Propionibacteriaceae bacterium]|nr:reverse transcriptase-like protein [Propionibacteriaceae bacterium]
MQDSLFGPEITCPHCGGRIELSELTEQPAPPALVLPADPDAAPVAPTLILRADGGSRGNPGPAAYGALVEDAATGEILNSEGLAIGEATNNVAEYSGLIAALEMAREIAPDAAIEVRMDSKLVIEQMAGRWKIKNPTLRPLALKATALRPTSVTWTWVPRAENTQADTLLNQALDGDPTYRR